MSNMDNRPDMIRQIQGESARPSGLGAHRPQHKRKRYKTKVGLPHGLAGACRRMPELRHNPRPDLPFDISRSETANWLVGTAVADPAFRQALFDAAYHDGLIVYDKERRTWRGKPDDDDTQCCD